MKTGIFVLILGYMYTLKKSLGQHFLKDESVCQRIVEALQQKQFERLLEVGPGGGALTKYLIQLLNIDFKLVEIDREKVDFLHNTYPQLVGKITEESILDVNIPFDQPFTLIGNFPYNISTQIVFKVIEWREQVETMIGMFQKEVAERLAAPHGGKDYGILTVLVQAYYDITYLFTVHENKLNLPVPLPSNPP
jgi:16S rRNA (adenine1518-N6/adenine1519-N6)-dimethyltransferase